MRIAIKYGLTRAILLLSIGFSWTLSAAVVPLDSGVEVTLAETSNIDVLKINPPNASGISVNRFSDFSVSNRELHILNIPKTVNGLTGEQTVDAAELTVIIADTISLNNTVKLIGPAANILFVTSSPNGNISCYVCRFENFLRVSLTTAHTNAITESSNTIGELIPGDSSSININHLFAPGTVDLDILTNSLSLSGTVETHQRAAVDADGGYVTDVNGNRTIGSGSTNLLLGPITWDYDQHQIASVNPTTITNTIGGLIRSSAVKVSAAGHLVVNSRTTTSANLLSSTTYRDSVYIPQEGVDIQTFANGNLTVSGDQSSEGTITLKATGDLSISSAQTDINSPQTKLIAGGTLSNVGRFEGAYIEMAADRLINQGELKADLEINLWAQKQLANQYGGSIKANTVRLQSVTQAIRNGSRTPYMSQDAETDYLFNMEDYVNQLDPTKLGTFYSLEEVDINNGSYVMAADNSAHIVANRIEIQGQAFENINPYYEKVESYYIPRLTDILDMNYVDQVSVSAENYLGIAATNYIVNSSAKILVNKEEGLFEANTTLLTNERYRSVTEFKYSESNSTGEPFCYFSCPDYFTIDTQNATTKLSSVSPPGVMFSFGDVNISSSQAIVNNMSYFEIFGDASFYTPVVNDIGYEERENLSKNVKKNYWIQLEGTKHENVITSTSTTINLTSNILGLGTVDSLFFIHGNLEASASLGWFKNHEPLDFYIQQAINNVVENHYPGITDVSGVSISSVSESKATGIIHIGNDEYSLFNELAILFDSLVDSVTNFFAELDWWN
ncbi:MAG: hypothetical protein ACRBCI_09520 [Cellvibrionaceae bacterium]